MQKAKRQPLLRIVQRVCIKYKRSYSILKRASSSKEVRRLSISSNCMANMLLERRESLAAQHNPSVATLWVGSSFSAEFW